MILVICLYILIASSFTFAKAALFYSEPLFYLGVRMVLAGSLLLAYCKIRGINLAIRREDYWHFLSIILFHIYISFALDLIALQFMTSFKAAFIFNLSPFISALFSYYYFSEVMTGRKWLGLGIGLLGFLPELITNISRENIMGNASFISWPEIMMIGSVITASFGWVIVRILTKKNYSPLMINGVGMFGGGILAFVTSLLFETWHPFPVTEWGLFFRYLLLTIIVANVLFYNLYSYLLRFYTATFLAFAGFLAPLFAALFGWLLLNEKVDFTFFFSLIVVTIGLVVFYYEELRQGYIKRS